METSILLSTKKILGIMPDYTAFDLDIITFINLAFSALNQLGVGPVIPFQIEDETSKWESLVLPTQVPLGMVKTYVYLKVRLAFDPPATSFHITALEKQILEHEVRLSIFREETAWALPLEDA